MWYAFIAIIRRELLRMLRQRGRLVSALVRPLMWLLIIGTGFEALLSDYGAGDYRRYLVPGLLGMVLLFGAMLASLSLVYDKEAGVMRMLIMAPWPHSLIIVARTVSASVVAVLQALMLLLVLIPMGLVQWPASLPLFLAGLLLGSLVCATMGMLIAVFSRTLDNFAVVMNFVIFPVFFLSGALYPLQDLDSTVRFVALLNPFSYAVDLLKHAMFASAPPLAGADFGIHLDIAVSAGFSAVALVIACLRFSSATVLERTARLLGQRR